MSADPSDDPATSQEQFQEAGARFTSMGEHWKAKLESDPELAQFMSDLWSQIQALNEEHKGEEKELYERDIDELKESALEQYGELESTTEYDLDAVTEGIEAIYELFSLLQGDFLDQMEDPDIKHVMTAIKVTQNVQNAASGFQNMFSGKKPG